MLNLKLQFGLECLIAISSYPLFFAWIFDIICFKIRLSSVYISKISQCELRQTNCANWKYFCHSQRLVNLKRYFNENNPMQSIIFNLLWEKKVKHYERHNGLGELSAFTNDLYNLQQAKQTNSKFSPNNLSLSPNCFIFKLFPSISKFVSCVKHQRVI